MHRYPGTALNHSRAASPQDIVRQGLEPRGAAFSAAGRSGQLPLSKHGGKLSLERTTIDCSKLENASRDHRLLALANELEAVRQPLSWAPRDS